MKLNVGGTYFLTTVTTLQSREGFLRSLSSTGARTPGVLPEFFIDRDPTHFRYILNYLRGSSVLPVHEIPLQELREEADFYSLIELRECIRKRLSMLS